MTNGTVATDANPRVEHVLEAALAQNGTPYMLPSDQTDLFVELTRKEGSHYGIQNLPAEAGYVKNQVTVRFRGTALVIEIRTPERVELA